jgi:hypothetical protein
MPAQAAVAVLAHSAAAAVRPNHLARLQEAPVAVGDLVS